MPPSTILQSITVPTLDLSNVRNFELAKLRKAPHRLALILSGFFQNVSTGIFMPDQTFFHGRLFFVKQACRRWLQSIRPRIRGTFTAFLERARRKGLMF